jgi:L-asparaginase
MESKTKILLIYTGGTIGMVKDSQTGHLVPFDFKQIIEQVPELSQFDLLIESVSFDQPIDSSNMSPKVWVDIVDIIEENYFTYDGFVILHGSDTMAYTASALSFMIENLAKPIIITGSQLPIGVIRTDGKENLVTAIEIAASKKNNLPKINEVAIYFEYRLYRGNRSHKNNAEQFEAFISPNYPILAEAGVNISYNSMVLLETPSKPVQFHKMLDSSVVVLTLFPGITEDVVSGILAIKSIKAIILHTFGSGNAMMEEWFVKLLLNGIQNGIHIVNVTQCETGTVKQGHYETSSALEKIGVISGKDITLEAAIVKLMLLLPKKLNQQAFKLAFETSMAGEISLE